MEPVRGFEHEARQQRHEHEVRGDRDVARRERGHDQPEDHEGDAQWQAPAADDHPGHKGECAEQRDDRLDRAEDRVVVHRAMLAAAHPHRPAGRVQPKAPASKRASAPEGA